MSDEEYIGKRFGDDEDFIIGDANEFDFTSSNLYKAVVAVTEGLTNDEIPDKYIAVLVEQLPVKMMNDSSYDEKFNLRDELTTQIRYVRGLREEVFDKKGRLRKSYTLDDAKHILTASRDLVKILQNSHDQLLTHDRMQAIELAFVDTVAKMPEKNRERYAELLGTYLESYDPK